MTIYKYKECDCCGITEDLDPVLVAGALPYNWIEVKVNRFNGTNLFKGIHHFCSQECLIKVVEGRIGM